jgi:hypothetical protein
MTTKVKSKRKAIARRPVAAQRRPSGTMNGRRPTALTAPTHVTRTGRNVFADLGFPAAEAANGGVTLRVSLTRTATAG